MLEFPSLRFIESGSVRTSVEVLLHCASTCRSTFLKKFGPSLGPFNLLGFVWSISKKNKWVWSRVERFRD